MVSNKNRLYIAIYPSGVVNNDERKYHWGFLIGPKSESQPQVPGTRYHVKNTPLQGWVYEEIPLKNVKSTATLLARILIAKVKDQARLVKTIQETPVVQNNPDWRCRTWVADALSRISNDRGAVGTAILDWHTIERFARDYVGKKSHQGGYRLGMDMSKDRPTWDLIESRELIA